MVFWSHHNHATSRSRSGVRTTKSPGWNSPQSPMSSTWRIRSLLPEIRAPKFLRIVASNSALNLSAPTPSNTHRPREEPRITVRSTT